VTVHPLARYRVTAVPFGGAWELHVHGLGSTQCLDLAFADRIVRGYLESAWGLDASRAEIEVTVVDAMPALPLPSVLED